MALAMSRRDPQDVGPELLTWHFADDIGSLQQIRRALGVELTARFPDAARDTLRAAITDSMNDLHRPHANRPTVAARAKQLGIRKKDLTRITDIADNLLKGWLVEAKRRFLAAADEWEGIGFDLDFEDHDVDETRNTLTLAQWTKQAVRLSLELALEASERAARESLEAMLVRIHKDCGAGALKIVRDFDVGATYQAPALVNDGQRTIWFLLKREGSLALRDVIAKSGVTDPAKIVLDEYMKAAGWCPLPMPRPSGFTIEADEEAQRNGEFVLVISWTHGMPDTRHAIRLPTDRLLYDWDFRREYVERDVVLHANHFWRATCTTTETPGASTHWAEWWPPKPEELEARRYPPPFQD